MKYRRPMISVLDILLIFIAIMGGLYHFIAKEVDKHNAYIKFETSDTISEPDLRIHYHISPQSSYDTIIQKNLFRSFYPTSENLVVTPKPRSTTESPPKEVKTKPIENKSRDIDVIVTGVVNDGKRIFILVENIKNRESKFITLGDTISDLKLIDIQREFAVFENNGQKFNIALGKTKVKL